MYSLKDIFPDCLELSSEEPEETRQMNCLKSLGYLQ